MPHAKNTRPKEKRSSEEGDMIALQDAPVLPKPSRILDFVDDEEGTPEDKPEGGTSDDPDSDETALPEDEELDANELNPFGDKWEE